MKDQTSKEETLDLGRESSDEWRFDSNGTPY